MPIIVTKWFDRSASVRYSVRYEQINEINTNKMRIINITHVNVNANNSFEMVQSQC